MRKMPAIIAVAISAILLTPLAAHADPPGWKTYTEPTASQCEASRKAFQSAGYQVTGCHPILSDQWYFQYQ